MDIIHRHRSRGKFTRGLADCFFAAMCGKRVAVATTNKLDCLAKLTDFRDTYFLPMSAAFSFKIKDHGRYVHILFNKDIVSKIEE